MGRGNIAAEPGLMNPPSNLTLKHGSPCIDAGTNLAGLPALDFAGRPRALDGNGDGSALPDMGMHEYDLRVILEPYMDLHSLDPNDPHVLSHDPDQDGLTMYQETLAGTDLYQYSVYTPILAISNGPPLTIYYQSGWWFTHSLQACTSLYPVPLLQPVPGATSRLGNNQIQSLVDPNADLEGPKFYRLKVDLPCAWRGVARPAGRKPISVSTNTSKQPCTVGRATAASRARPATLTVWPPHKPGSRTA